MKAIKRLYSSRAMVLFFCIFNVTAAQAAIIWDDFSFRYAVEENTAEVYDMDVNRFDPVVTLPGPTLQSSNTDGETDPVDSRVDSSTPADASGLGLNFRAGAGGRHLSNGVRIEAYASTSTTSGGVLFPYAVGSPGNQEAFAFSNRNFHVNSDQAVIFSAKVGGVINDPGFSQAPFLRADYTWAGGVWLDEIVTRSGVDIVLDSLFINIGQLLSISPQKRLVNLRTRNANNEPISYSLRTRLDLDSLLVNYNDQDEFQAGDIPIGNLGSLGQRNAPVHIEASLDADMQPFLATRSHDKSYIAGLDFVACIEITYQNSLTALSIRETIPDNWVLASVSGADTPNTFPPAGSAGTLEFIWNTIPASPVNFCYSVQVPATASDDAFITGTVLYSLEDAGTPPPDSYPKNGGLEASTADLQQVSILPNPDYLSGCTFHSADFNPSDLKIDLSELNRVIQLYSADSYHCNPGFLDGYAPGVGPLSCFPHNSDYNPWDWIINLSELLRAIQFYNIGSYDCEASAEDGYAPGNAGSELPAIPATESSLNAVHFAGEYAPGSNLTVTAQIQYTGILSAAGIEVNIPPGWSFVSAFGMDTPDILPPFGRSGTLNFAWITPPASPIIFSYTVSVPTNPAGIQQLNAKIRYRRLAGEVPTPVQPNPLVFESCEADFDKDGDIDGYDLLEATKAGNEVNLSDFAQKYGRLNCD